MKIAHIAPLWYNIPPTKYGGTEKVISYLVDDLVDRGHEVTLFATGNSKTKAKLVSTRDVSLVESGIPWRDSFANTDNVATAFRQAGEFDVIHSHLQLTGAFFAQFTKTPVLHTMHNIPGLTDWRWDLLGKYKDIYNPVFISRKQQELSPVVFPHSWVAYNGIDISIYEFNDKPEDYYIWIGLVTKAKGIENAIAAAKKSGIKLILAGKVDETNQEYFDKSIKPELNDKIQFIGELGGKTLTDYYKNAKGLIYPINWHEPFGLVIVEAMASGTPVIAYAKGSVPEIVQDSVNGFIVDSIDGVIEAVNKIETIDRKKCRETVERKFTKERMTDAYEVIYKELANLHAQT